MPSSQSITRLVLVQSLSHTYLGCSFFTAVCHLWLILCLIKASESGIEYFSFSRRGSITPFSPPGPRRSSMKKNAPNSAVYYSCSLLIKSAMPIDYDLCCSCLLFTETCLCYKSTPVVRLGEDWGFFFLRFLGFSLKGKGKWWARLTKNGDVLSPHSPLNLAYLFI